jgi:hypothetical protein
MRDFGCFLAELAITADTRPYRRAIEELQRRAARSQARAAIIARAVDDGACDMRVRGRDGRLIRLPGERFSTLLRRLRRGVRAAEEGI